MPRADNVDVLDQVMIGARDLCQGFIFTQGAMPSAALSVLLSLCFQQFRATYILKVHQICIIVLHFDQQ